MDRFLAHGHGPVEENQIVTVESPVLFQETSQIRSVNSNTIISSLPREIHGRATPEDRFGSSLSQTVPAHLVLRIARARFTYLVKGGSGCIGGHLTKRFLSEGHDVVPLDQMHPYYNLGIKPHTIDRCERLATESKGPSEFIQGDVRDAALVE